MFIKTTMTKLCLRLGLFLALCLCFQGLALAETPEDLTAGGSLVRVKSTYANSCMDRKQKCKKSVDKNGFGLIFRYSDPTNSRYFIVTTSHVSQGTHLQMTSFDQKRRYTEKVYTQKAKQTLFRTTNNDADIDIFEIEDPKLASYFDIGPVPKAAPNTFQICSPVVFKPEILFTEEENKSVFDTVDGLQSVDMNMLLTARPQYNWDLQEQTIGKRINRGQSGYPILVKSADATDARICLLGLLKGFNRYFEKSYLEIVDGNPLLARLMTRIKGMNENKLAFENLTEIQGKSIWKVKGGETYRVTRIPGVHGEVSEIRSWYSPTGGSDTVDVGGSETADGGGEGLQQNLKSGESLIYEGLQYQPGLSLNNKPILGFDFFHGTRSLYANIGALSYLTQESKETPDYLTEDNLKGQLIERINRRLKVSAELKPQIDFYRQIYLFIYFKNEAKEYYDRGVFLQTFGGQDPKYLKQAETAIFLSNLLKELKPVFLAESSKVTPPDCSLEINDKTIDVEFYAGHHQIEFEDQEGKDMLHSTNPFRKFYGRISLDHNLKVIDYQFPNNTNIQLINKALDSTQLDLRPKVFSSNEPGNSLIIDLKGLLFLDFNAARVTLTTDQNDDETYAHLLDRVPNLLVGPFNKFLDEQQGVREYSVEGNLFSRAAHIQLKAFNTKKDYLIPCYRKGIQDR